MAKSRTKRGDKELDQLDRLKQENKKLKRELARYRKIVDRFDLDRYEHIKEILQEEDKRLKHAEFKKLEKAWRCHDCQAGILRLRVIDRRDGTYYNRVCDGCGKRTSFQRYTKNVKGVK